MGMNNKLSFRIKKKLLNKIYSGKKDSFSLFNPITYLRKIYGFYAQFRIKKNQNLWNALQEMLSKSDSTGCEFSDYLTLYQLVLRNQPKHIMECGSGISTCVIAFAIREIQNRGGDKISFVSLEENEHYHEQVKKIFPKDLVKYVDFRIAARKEDWFGGYLGSFYDINYVNEKKIDLLFIDGPTDRRTWNDRSTPKTFNADILKIREVQGGHLQALLDQRLHTYWILKQLLTQAKVCYNPIKKTSLIDIR